MGYVYILEVKNKGEKEKYYVGSTLRTLEERIKEHTLGWSRWTSRYEIVRLIYAVEVPNKNTRFVEYLFKRNRRIVYEIAKKKRDYYYNKVMGYLSSRNIPCKEVE